MDDAPIAGTEIRDSYDNTTINCICTITDKECPYGVLGKECADCPIYREAYCMFAYECIYDYPRPCEKCELYEAWEELFANRGKV